MMASNEEKPAYGKKFYDILQNYVHKMAAVAGTTWAWKYKISSFRTGEYFKPRNFSLNQKNV